MGVDEGNKRNHVGFPLVVVLSRDREMSNRGRKPKFQGAVAKVIVGVLKASGLTGGKAALAELGASLQGVSLPTLAKIADEAGVKFTKGRKVGSTVEKAEEKPKKSKKRGPGRPKGSKNKAKVAKRGRPLGSKNKPKDAPVTQAPVIQPDESFILTPVTTEVQQPVVAEAATEVTPEVVAKPEGSDQAAA